MRHRDRRGCFRTCAEEEGTRATLMAGSARNFSCTPIVDRCELIFSARYTRRPHWRTIERSWKRQIGRSVALRGICLHVISRAAADKTRAGPSPRHRENRRSRCEEARLSDDLINVQSTTFFSPREKSSSTRSREIYRLPFP